MKIRLKESVMIDANLRYKDTVIEVSDSLYNTLKSDGVKFEEVIEKKKAKNEEVPL